MNFSIITPSFDQLEYLKLCAKSVEDQKGRFSSEHIIQEGCGGEEFEKWVSNQRLAQCYCENDDGMYDAINRGVDKAQGEIIAWLNCDEQYLPGTLAKVKKWFDSNPDHEILVGDVILVKEDGSPLAYRSAFYPWKNHVKSCFLPTYSAATFVRKRVFTEGHRLDTRYRMIADAVWIVSLLESDYRIGIMNEPLSTFTQTGENMGQSLVGIEEWTKWREANGSDGLFRSTFWSVAHRLRKLIRGGYFKKIAKYKIYSATTSKRKCFEGKLGERWPRFS